jgi:4-amino-4-deoxy-L-arabinose transferase-like glycosyltransferase
MYLTTKSFVKLCLLCTLFINILLFTVYKKDTFSSYYYLFNFLSFFTSILVFKYSIDRFRNKELTTSYLFKVSIVFRILIFCILYYILYYFYNADLSIEEYDTTFYDNLGTKLVYIYKNNFSIDNIHSLIKGIEFDDLGYPFILSLKYLFFRSIIISKLIQAIVDSLSVVLIYKISIDLFNSRIAKLSSLFSSIFLPMITMAFITTKEVYMTFFTLLCIYSYQMLSKNKSKSYIIYLIFSILILFSMRTVFAIIVLLSIIVSLFFNSKKSIKKKIFYPIFIFIGLLLMLGLFGFYNEVKIKTFAYAGISLGEESNIGGRSQDEYLMKGQSFAKYASLPVLFTQALITPYPSLSLTNMQHWGISMQWFFSGGLFLWVFSAFFCIKGMILSLSNKKALHILLIIILYTIVLLSSFYITSIRFNILKINIMLIFFGYGFMYQSKKTKLTFYIYSLLISITIFIWNYAKIHGR